MGVFGSAALLAGGRSTRMGGIDKQGISLGGEPLGRRGALSLESVFDEVLVVTPRPEIYRGLRVRCVEDRIPGRGPLSGIHAALAAASHDWVYVMACDMPFFSPEYEAFLRGRVAEALDRGLGSGKARLNAAAARYGPHVEPFHAYYSRAALPAVEELLRSSSEGREPSVHALLQGLPCLWIPEAEVRAFSQDWSLFCNVNVPGELERIEALAAATDGIPG
jgi:molybdenum cofactor guanylyltransferase